jgi:hypothetical protein
MFSKWARWYAGLSAAFRRLAVAVAIAGFALVAAVPTAALAASCWKMQKSLDPGGSTHNNVLRAVAATSPSSAWAVGYYTSAASPQGQTLIEHWNGTSWKVQKSMNPGGASEENSLYGVAATSATNAWAVGRYYNGSAYQTLIEHWNGSAWTVQTSPDPAGSSDVNAFNAVAAAGWLPWAVGVYGSGSGQHTLAAVFNANQWLLDTSSQNPGALDVLNGVTARSKSSTWAVGDYSNGLGGMPSLIEYRSPVQHAWVQQKSPNPLGSTGITLLQGVAATSSTNAWAVGYYGSFNTQDQALIAHYNGTGWKVQKSFNPGGTSAFNGLLGVAATSATNAWAVGYYDSAAGAIDTLIEHWPGGSWKLQSSPNPGGTAFGNQNQLYGVAATSSTNAWAVGDYVVGGFDRTLVLHCG